MDQRTEIHFFEDEMDVGVAPPRSFAIISTLRSLRLLRDPLAGDLSATSVSIGVQYKAVLECIHSVFANKREREFESALRLWGVCSTLDDDDPLYLPPFFGTKELLSLFESVHKSLSTIDKKRSAGNFVLHGIAGVGKSTLLRAAAITGALLLDIAVLHWDYADESEAESTSTPFVRQPSPGDLLWYCVGTGNLSPPWHEFVRHRPFPSVLPAMPGVRGVCLLADGVNALYTAEDPHRAAGVHIITNMFGMGKQPRVMVVLSGSSATLRSKLFCAPQSVWHRLGYPAMNHSVFTICDISPIRDLHLLKCYAQARFGLDHIPDSILAETGGVMRLADAFVCSHQPFEESHFRSFIMSSPAAVIFASALLTINQTLLRDGKLTNLAIAIIPGITEQQLRVRPDAVNPTPDQFLAWQDAGFVLVSPNGRIELLVPRALETIHATLHRDMDTTMALALRVTIRGWDACGAAGASAEPLVLRRFSRCLGCLPGDSIEITQMDGTATLWNGVTRSNEPLSFTLLEAMRKRLLRISADDGCDAFLVDWPDDDPRSIAVTVVRIKVGLRGNKITSGVLHIQQQNLLSKRHDDDTTVAGIVVKMDRSYRNIRAILQCSCSDAGVSPRIHLDRAILLTNLIVQDTGDVAATHALLDGCALLIRDNRDFYDHFADCCL